MDLYYELRRPVLMRDCDMFRRLRPSAVLTLFQDCSEALTEGWGVGLAAMMEKGVTWVAAKVSCEAKRLPIHGESITIRGWAGRCRSGICPFHYVITDGAGEEVITGCALWVLADMATHSMMAPNVPRIQLPTPEPENARLPRMAAIKPPEAFQTTTRRALFSETDINGHLTNTRYLDWVCDLADAGFHRERPMTGLRINFRAEILPGEELTLRWAAAGDRLWCTGEDRFEADIYF